MNKDPKASDIVTEKRDGSYALYLRMNDLAAGESQSLDWYYAAGQASVIDDIIDDVSQDAGTTTPPTPPVENTIPETTAVTTAQHIDYSTPGTSHIGTMSMLPSAPPPSPFDLSSTIGSMDIIELSNADFNAQQRTHERRNQENGEPSQDNPPNANEPTAQRTSSPSTKVFVVDGGVRLPSWANFLDKNKKQ